MRRTKKQIEASKRNGKRSAGPRSAAGKQASSGNAKQHSLTGQIEPEAEEARKLALLYERLTSSYPRSTPGTEALIGIVMDAQLRMMRAYHLLDIYAARLFRGINEGEEMLGDANPTLIAIRELQATLGQGNQEDRSQVDRLIGSSYLLTHNQKPLSTKLMKLTYYAQRFRGQRDRALKRLNQLNSEL